MEPQVSTGRIGGLVSRLRGGGHTGLRAPAGLGPSVGPHVAVPMELALVSLRSPGPVRQALGTHLPPSGALGQVCTLSALGVHLVPLWGSLGPGSSGISPSQASFPRCPPDSTLLSHPVATAPSPTHPLRGWPLLAPAEACGTPTACALTPPHAPRRAALQLLAALTAGTPGGPPEQPTPMTQAACRLKYPSGAWAWPA